MEKLIIKFKVFYKLKHPIKNIIRIEISL